MTLNGSWHRAHPMPRNPSIEDRIRWHLEHAKACGCRPVPASVVEELRKRGQAPP